MKKLLFLIVLLYPMFAVAEEIKLVWDQPQSAIDGFRCFQKTAYPDDSYNYDDPVKPKNYPTGNIPANINSIIVDVAGEPDAVLKYLWVCRAYKVDIESADSNEVSYKVVRTIPPVPVNLTGSYDDDQKSVHLAWEQPQDGHIIYKWILYYRFEEQTEFNDLGIVNYGHELTLTAPFNLVAEGEKKKIAFVVVAFRRSGVYSANSQELMLEIDREIVGPLQNLKIDIDIPVE